MLWGFAGTASGMTAVGKDLFANIVENLISFPYLPTPDLVVTGYEEAGAFNRYFLSVLNLSAFPDVLFTPAPDLPPCGLNENSSRTWVRIYDSDNNPLQGFCGLGSSESLDGIWFAWPVDETPPDVYIVLTDRRSGITYTSGLASAQGSPASHTIINNIITNNSNGIFYYFFAKYDSQILYNDVWGNSKNYHDNVSGFTAFVPYPGTGEISENPLFVDTNDYYLDDGSPCRDTGHPGMSYNDPDGTRNDMGVYGGPEASGLGGWSGSGFIFTSIGDIPTAAIIQNAGDTSHGLADVNATMASDFGIPRYQDSPFGGLLKIYGLFGNSDTNVDYYQIMVAKWNGSVPPAPGDYQPLSRGLAKVKYIINPDFTVSYQNVSLGPKTIGVVDNLYQLTTEGYWYHIDLRILWDTRLEDNGKYTITYRAYEYFPPPMDFVIERFPTSNTMDHLTVIVDNNPVIAEIHNVKYDPCSPYYDDPCDGEIPECGIINLTNDTENLRFNITAKHPNGYLRSYTLDMLYGKNRYGGVIDTNSYTTSSPPYWLGVEGGEVETDNAPGALVPWQRCAYQFRLRAYSRTTNGLHYIYSSEFSDHYFLDLGVSECERADLDGSGKIDFFDFRIFAEHWPDLCTP